ncbi:MAG TPA: TetR family transcriptional regulator [Acidimicrobiales bacterium]|nr:TetR family transcriptional regulator [Acidimicrobiales bacterium]
MTAIAAMVPRRFTMSELVERTGVAAATVRYYLAAGVLPAPEKVAANRFLYDERHVELVRLIRLVRERRGLPIESIGRLLPEVLPDLFDKPSRGVFRPEMWNQLLAAETRLEAGAFVDERLIESGLALFSRRGYADVSIDDVCRSALIAKGSFYRHYPSKEALFFAVAEEAARQAAREFEAPPSGGDAGASAIDRMATVLVPYVTVFLDLASLATQRRPGSGRELSRVADPLVASVAGRSSDDLIPPEETVGRAFIEAVCRAAGERGPAAVLIDLQLG